MLRRCALWLLAGCLLGVLAGAVMGVLTRREMRHNEARGRALEAELATLADARAAIGELKTAREELLHRQAIVNQLQRHAQPDVRLYHRALDELTRHSGVALESYRWRNAELSLTVRAQGDAELARFAELCAADPRVELFDAESWKRPKGDGRFVLELRWRGTAGNQAQGDAVEIGGGS